MVDEKVPVGGVPALGLGSSLVSHASKYDRKNELVSCSYYSPSHPSSLPCVARKWLSLEAFTRTSTSIWCRKPEHKQAYLIIKERQRVVYDQMGAGVLAS